MKNFVSFSAVCVILTIIGIGCSTAKVNFRTDNQGNMVVEQTETGKHAISDNAVSASRDAADFEKNMVVKAMWKKYLSLVEKGEISKAQKILIEIKKISGEMPMELPKENVSIVPPKKNYNKNIHPNDLKTYDNGDGQPSLWKR